MKNWKIGIRMAAGFSAVLAIAVALGVVAYTRVVQIDRQAVVITTDALPGVYTIGQAQGNVHHSLALLLEAATSPDKAEVARLEGQVSSLRTTNQFDADRLWQDRW
jgi:hypothetical protein